MLCHFFPLKGLEFVNVMGASFEEQIGNTFDKAQNFHDTMIHTFSNDKQTYGILPIRRITLYNQSINKLKENISYWKK